MSNNTTIDKVFERLETLNLSDLNKRLFIVFWLENINFNTESTELQNVLFTKDEINSLGKGEFNHDLYEKANKISEETNYSCELYGKPLINEIVNRFK